MNKCIVIGALTLAALQIISHREMSFSAHSARR
jgi:hypothetical protein